MERAKSLAGVLVALLCLALAWRGAAGALRSDEDRLRAALAEMVDGFNSATVRRAVERLHPDFTDRESASKRSDVVDALRGLFFQSFSRGGVRYRVELPPAEIDIQIDAQKHTARVALRAVFTRTGAGTSEVWWDARAVTRWLEDGEGWRMLESLEVNHRDRRR